MPKIDILNVNIIMFGIYMGTEISHSNSYGFFGIIEICYVMQKILALEIWIPMPIIFKTSKLAYHKYEKYF